jgi:hypothetical protein
MRGDRGSLIVRPGRRPGNVDACRMRDSADSAGVEARPGRQRSRLRQVGPPALQPVGWLIWSWTPRPAGTDRRLTLMLNLADEAFTVAVNGEVLEASSPPAEPGVPPHAWAVLAG